MNILLSFRTEAPKRIVAKSVCSKKENPIQWQPANGGSYKFLSGLISWLFIQMSPADELLHQGLEVGRTAHGISIRRKRRARPTPF